MSYETVTYKRENMIQCIRIIKYILISTRKIGDYSIDAANFEIKEELFNYIVDSNMLDKLANVREILEGEFENLPRIGDISFLEKATEDIEYWTPGSSGRV